jgi:cold shock CspA family protein
VTRAPERAAVFRGRVAVSPGTDGYGFIEPDCGGGELLFRDSNMPRGFRLRVGESIRYALADGSFALEAVDVQALPVTTCAGGHRGQP